MQRDSGIRMLVFDMKIILSRVSKIFIAEIIKQKKSNLGKLLFSFLIF